MKPVFEYLDYRAYLKDFYEERKSEFAFFSYRMLAESFGLFPSNVFRILHGDAHLPSRCQSRAVEVLGLSGRSAEYFQLLISYARERSVKARNEILEKAMALRDVSRKSLEDRELAYFDHWWVAVVRALLEVTKGRSVPGELAGLLVPAVEEEEVRAALDLLEDLKLVKKASSGRILPTEAHLTAGGEAKAKAVPLPAPNPVLGRRIPRTIPSPGQGRLHPHLVHGRTDLRRDPRDPPRMQEADPETGGGLEDARSGDAARDGALPRGRPAGEGPMNRLCAIRAILPCALLLGCFDDRSAGTSTETENAVAARSILVDSVLQPWESSLAAPTVATLRLDSTNFDFARSRDSGLDIAVEAEDSSPIPFDVVSWDRVADRGRIQVRIDGPRLLPLARFLLVWNLPVSHRSDPAAVWSGITDSQKLSLNSVLVDDFEGGSILHNRLPDTSFWYVGGFIPSSGLSSAGAGRAGTAFHLVCGPGQCDTGRTTLAATLLATSPRSLRSMDSIVFWARGTGSIWVAMEHLDSLQLLRIQKGQIDSLQPLRAWTSRALDTAWREIRLAPTDFDPPDGKFGNIGWTGVRDSLNYITFQIQGGAEMWIDDIRVHGINRADLR